MAGGRDGRDRLNVRYGIPIAAALTLHAALLLLVLGWRPPPYGKATVAAEIFLVSARGSEPLSTPATPSPAEALQVAPPPVITPPPTLLPPQSEPQRVTTSPAEPEAIRTTPSTKVQTSLEALIESNTAPQLDAEAAPLSFSPQAAAALNLPSSAGASKNCQILQTLQASLSSSSEVRKALAAIPRQSRSVANAILLWNGRWLDLTASREVSPLEPIERVVMQDVGAAAPACRSELLHGPRLILLGDANDTVVLAFGSGDWRWADTTAASSPSGLK